jgi:hypothetical protein
LLEFKFGKFYDNMAATKLHSLIVARLSESNPSQRVILCAYHRQINQERQASIIMTVKKLIANDGFVKNKLSLCF